MKSVADGFATNFLIPRSSPCPRQEGPYRACSTTSRAARDKRKREREDAEVAANRSPARP